MKNISQWIKQGAVFATHQVVATEGVIWLTILASFLLQASIDAVRFEPLHSAVRRAAHLIFSNTPFFPVQIAVGGYFGWKIFSRWRHRSMLWVWILPAVWIAYAVAVTLRVVPWSLSAGIAILSHYFGWGCQADHGCYDQLTFTQPLYASAAYTCGALWAARNPKAVNEMARRIQRPHNAERTNFGH